MKRILTLHNLKNVILFMPGRNLASIHIYIRATEQDGKFVDGCYYFQHPGQLSFQKLSLKIKI